MYKMLTETAIKASADAICITKSQNGVRHIISKWKSIDLCQRPIYDMS